MHRQAMLILTTIYANSSNRRHLLGINNVNEIFCAIFGVFLDMRVVVKWWLATPGNLIKIYPHTPSTVLKTTSRALWPHQIFPRILSVRIPSFPKPYGLDPTKPWPTHNSVPSSVLFHSRQIVLEVSKSPTCSSFLSGFQLLWLQSCLKYFKRHHCVSVLL